MTPQQIQRHRDALGALLNHVIDENQQLSSETLHRLRNRWAAIEMSRYVLMEMDESSQDTEAQQIMNQMHADMIELRHDLDGLSGSMAS